MYAFNSSDMILRVNIVGITETHQTVPQAIKADDDDESDDDET